MRLKLELPLLFPIFVLFLPLSFCESESVVVAQELDHVALRKCAQDYYCLNHHAKADSAGVLPCLGSDCFISALNLLHSCATIIHSTRTIFRYDEILSAYSEYCQSYSFAPKVPSLITVTSTISASQIATVHVVEGEVKAIAAASISPIDTNATEQKNRLRKRGKLGIVPVIGIVIAAGGIAFLALIVLACCVARVSSRLEMEYAQGAQYRSASHHRRHEGNYHPWGYEEDEESDWNEMRDRLDQDAHLSRMRRERQDYQDQQYHSQQFYQDQQYQSQQYHYQQAQQ